MTDKFTASSFADYIVGQRKRPVTFLDKIDSVHPETPYLRPTLALSVWVILLGDPGIQGLNIRFACDMVFSRES